jgi:glutamate/tyrosine decarboxylase-like PLP-dependent enzyme
MNNNWKCEYNRLVSLFLDDGDSNSSLLMSYLSNMLEELNKSGDSAYIGGSADHDYSFLRNDGFVPEKGEEAEVVLSTALRALHGGLKWNNTGVMHNVNPQPMLATVAISAICNMFNLNGIWDFVSAGAHSMEKSIVRQLSTMFLWNESDGVFTFGGKGCLTYAVRIGLNRCCKSVSSCGLLSLKGNAPVVVTSSANHYTIKTVCSLLGIGIDNCVMTRVKDNDCVDVGIFEKTLEGLLAKNRPIACVIVSGGNTLHLAVDNVNDICNVVDKLAYKYRLTYKPYIYLDSVVGWPWIFFCDYNFRKNELSIPEKILKKIKYVVDKLRGINRVDGFGVDFHKTGFCPYISSLFISKKGSELHSIHADEVRLLEQNEYGNNFSQHHMIEHSRSVAPIFSAYVALKIAGKNGFRSYIVNMLEVTDTVVSVLSSNGFEHLNSFSCGFASVFCPICVSRDYSYHTLLNGSVEDIRDYNFYVFQLFHYLSDRKNNGIGDFVLRFLPQYGTAKSGENVSVIVVYPMAISSSADSIKPVLEQIVAAKNSFDVAWDTKKQYASKDNMPRHVPK